MKKRHIIIGMACAFGLTGLCGYITEKSSRGEVEVENIEKITTSVTEGEVTADAIATAATVTTTTTATTTTTTTAATTITTTTTTTITTTTTTTIASTTTTTTTTSYMWEGVVLTPEMGVVSADQTPSGYRETYYNLSMYGCLDLMGWTYDGYSIRSSDGVKLYNGYVMVATPDLQLYPKGSYIPTTLGMGIVVDFCPEGNLDIAVNW